MEGHPDASPSYCVLHSQTKEFVYRINEYFLKEKANREKRISINQARKRIADAARISEATVKWICSSANKTCGTTPQPYQPVFTSPKKNRLYSYHLITASTTLVKKNIADKNNYKLTDLKMLVKQSL
ncbi:hypothetical protein E2C01_047482 [Portunus trituberculatus]|uniref:Uncharacterized protein n=1 Tax=Portunus trituberculatus TaxID=210409 RepID=A0A5B7G808_PORTR|nr:hypothetical protein [Portunus trituberculatus]